MRVLVFADQRPPADPAELVAANAPELVVTLGDLEPNWLASLASTDVPKVGVHGNHDGVDDLRTLGIEDLHLSRAEMGGWSFTGFEGSVRVHAPGPHLFSQDEAARLIRDLPAADVLVSHSPPLGINDAPDDPAHVGFEALREWVERHQPRYLLHGHTTPDPRTRLWRLGPTEIVWVRGAMTVDLRQ
jgi:Icc-related predicted phosphoesterase